VTFIFPIRILPGKKVQLKAPMVLTASTFPKTGILGQ